MAFVFIGAYMAHHLIFIEHAADQPQDKPSLFKSVGLEDHVGGCDAIDIIADESPSGKQGKLFAWRKPGDDQLIVDKAKQTWMKSKLGYHVGIWTEKPPTESALRRIPTKPKGVWVSLAGEKWKLPTPATIDRQMELDEEGDWQSKPLRELAWYTDEMDKRLAEMEPTEENGVQMTRVRYDFSEVTALIVRALRINYRITPEVCHLLRMFTTEIVSDCYGHMLGPGFETNEVR